MSKATRRFVMVVIVIKMFILMSILSAKKQSREIHDVLVHLVA